MTQRICDDPGISRHAEATDYFNQLLLDLKKQLLGYPHKPITMDRLNEGSKHIVDLDQCREPMKFY